MARPNSFKLRVVEVVRETADAHSLVLEPSAEDAGSFDYRPGQFLTFDIPSDREGGAARCYSLSSSPHRDSRLKVTVKRTADGYGSNWICDNISVGDHIESLRPAGRFTPGSLDGDFLLVAGGSGITPVMSILKSALQGGSGRITLVYANRDERSVIFRDELVALTAEHPERLHVVHLLESVQGIPSEATLRELLRPHSDREAFVCGPGPFMDRAVRVLGELGAPGNRVRVERFLSLTNDPFEEADVGSRAADGPDTTVEVELDGVTSTLRWPPGNRMLEVFLAAGLGAPFSCREGACSACACVVLDGEVEMAHNEVLEEDEIAEGYVLACQAVPLSERVRVTYEP